MFIYRTLQDNEISLLRKAKHVSLASYDMALAAPPKYAWNTVRLHADSCNIDINNHLDLFTLDNDESVEEFGVLTANIASDKVLEVADIDTETSVIPVNKPINNIFIINNKLDIYDKGEMITRYIYTQAVAFMLGEEYLVLDKETWFSEMIAVKRGLSLKQLIYDESQDWLDDPIEDPDTHYEFSQEIVEL